MSSDPHPSTFILASDSNWLAGKTIIIGITGSVAAFHSPAIARELIRHGAKVIPVMSKSGLSMIGKDLMWWATGNEPVTEVTGDLEHIRYAGVMNKPVDLMLIAPCTTNTLAKLASGIADTPVSLIVSTLLGKGIPLVINPVAHEDLINSPIIKEALEKLRSIGVEIIEPLRLEGKAKVPDLSDLVFETMCAASSKDLTGKSVIITGGPTREYVDDVRFISNDSSGRTGVELAKRARMLGASTRLVIGPISLGVPRILDTYRVTTSGEMTTKVLDLLKAEPGSIVFLSAAMADFTPVRKASGKIKSGQTLSLELEPTLKLSDLIKTRYPNCKLVLFKAEYNVTKDELAKRAMTKLKHCNADLIVANDLGEEGAGFQSITNHVLLLGLGGSVELMTEKRTLFDEIYRILEQGFR